MAKKICITLIIILTCVLIGFFVFTYTHTDETSIDANNFNSKVSALEVSKRKVQAKIDEINQKYDIAERGNGLVVLLFTDLDDNLYTHTKPMMDLYGICGDMLLTTTVFPGRTGCMSLANFKDMINSGWGYCVRYDGTIDFTQFLNTMKYNFSRMGLAQPSVVFFDEGAYLPEFETIMAMNHYNIAIHHGENGLPVVSSVFDVSSGVWKFGASTAFYSKHTAKIEEANLTGGAVGFTLGSRSEKEAYTDEMLKSILEQLKDYSDRGVTTPTVSSMAFLIKQQNESLKPDLEVQRNAELAPLLTELDSYTNEIKKLNDSYLK